MKYKTQILIPGVHLQLSFTLSFTWKQALDVSTAQLQSKVIYLAILKYNTNAHVFDHGTIHSLLNLNTPHKN